MPDRAPTRRQVLRRRRLVVLAGLLLVLVGASTLVVRAGQAAWAAVSDRWSAARTVAATGPDAPAWIAVPDAGIDHALTPGGVDDAGAINPDRGDVIWFTGGDRAVPGAEGIAVVAGHVEYYGKPDVFATLATVEVGDRVRIGQVDGDVIDLTIRRTVTMDKDELRRSDLVWGDATDERLVALVTCDDALGTRADGHRAANFVALAEVD